MKEKFYQIILLLFLILLQGCSSGGREERLELLNFYQAGAIDQALGFLEKSKFYQGPNEKLLALMEKGMLLHASGDYEKSSLILSEAKALVDELYTVSISKKTQKVLLNDNYDIYYGDFYERSLIHFYLSLNAILNYQKSKNRDDLFKARAAVLGWDSYLEAIKEERLGRSVYKKDLLLKLYGAKIHEMIDTREDLQIALQLYKDAKDILLKNYNSYPAFNLRYKDFKKDYENLANLKLEDLKSRYIQETDLQKSLQEYISQNINRLSVKGANQKPKSNRLPVTILLQKGSIAQKVAEKSFYGLDFLSKDPIISLYVADVLGLLPAPNTYNPNGAFMGVMVANTALKSIGVGFELPKITNNIPPAKMELIVLDSSQIEVAVKDIALVNPLGDIAEEAVFESSAWTYSRVGARLAAKHAAAILSSFATYKALGGAKGGDDFLAKNAAMIQYIGAAKVIEESEKADTRYWSTLPNEIRLVDLDLPAGTYELQLKIPDKERINLGMITVEDRAGLQLFSIRKSL